MNAWGLANTDRRPAWFGKWKLCLYINAFMLCLFHVLVGTHDELFQ